MTSNQYYIEATAEGKKLLYLCDFGWSEHIDGVTLFPQAKAEKVASQCTLYGYTFQAMPYIPEPVATINLSDDVNSDWIRKAQ